MADLGKIKLKYQLCPYQQIACDNPTRCHECEHGPKDILTKEVIERFEQEPWALYCLTCGEFILTRYNHPEDHVIATGIRDCIAKIPDHVMKNLGQ